MNRKLILGALMLVVLAGVGVSCSVQQPNEGCAIETGSLFFPIQYWARYTISQPVGNCAFFQTYDPAGNLLKDSSGNLLAGEEIDVLASTASGEERSRLWSLLAEAWPAYDDYQRKTEREIPVVVLSRR